MRGDAPGRLLGLALIGCSSLLLLLGLACSHEPRTPEAVAKTFAAALRDHDLERAYALLSSETRARVDRTTFERLVRDNPTEMERLVHLLAERPDAVDIVATVVTDAGDTVRLVYEGGGWRLEGGVLSVYPQGTPREALASFIRAYDAGRYDVLLGFVPRGDREGLTAEALEASFRGAQRTEVERIVGALRAALPTAPIEELGDRATMSYGSGAAELVLEDGAWKVEDFQ